METRKVHCAVCGADVTQGKFCGECGAALDPLAPAQADVIATADGASQVPAASDPSKRRWWWLAGTGGVLTIAIVVVGLWVVVARDSSDKHAIEGTFSLLDTDEFLFDDEGDPCTGSGGYDDVQEGAQIRVRDGEGRSLANAALGPGEIAFAGLCEFRWEAEVPRTEFYRFEMGRRGEIEYTYAELADNGWKVELSLGSVDD